MPESETHASPLRPAGRAAHLRTLGRYLLSRPRESGAALACMVVLGGLLVLLPRWTAVLVGEVLPTSRIPPLLRHLGWGMALVAAIAVLTTVRDTLLMRLGARFAARLREAMLDRTLHRPLAAVADRLSGELLSRLTNDVTLLHRYLVDGLAVFVPNLLTAAVMLGAMFAVSWQLSLGTIVLAVPMVLVVNSFWRRLHAAVGRSQTQLAEMTAFVGDCLDGLREAKAFGREAFLRERFAVLSARTLRVHLGEERMVALYPNAVMLVGVAGLSGLLLLSTWLVVRGQIDTPALVSYLVLLGVLVGPMQETTRSGSALTRLFAIMDRCAEVLEAPVEQEAPDTPPLPRLRGALRFDDVAVRRPGTGFVLGPLSLDVAAGETVAIVGASGAGKSTLLDLVPRLVEPSGGRLLADDMPIAAYRRDSLRAQVGVVSQEPFLFPGTLLENLRFGRPDASREEVLAAARAAHVEEFAARMPRGYDTPLDRRGGNLSMGQRQRIALARAVLKDPPILLLDEPTSALDVESERLLQDSLRHVCAGRTTLIVTHRPSLVRNAHRIVVMAAGRVTDIGTTTELVDRGTLPIAFADAMTIEAGS